MTIRYDDNERSIALSVLDLVERISASGHLRLDVVQSSTARMALGRWIHAEYQQDRAEGDAAFRAEVRLRHQLAVGDWTVVLWGRVDGLTEEDGRTVVEEVKSTALDAGRLFGTTAADWGRYVAQVELYLWMLGEARHPDPSGRLVLVSLVDGARHVIGVSVDLERIGRRVRDEVERLVEDRIRRLAWLAARREAVVPALFDAWRPGQEALAEGIEAALPGPVLVEAPTGFGKTAAVLYAVLRRALATDKQVFWATARTTQQAVVTAALERLAERGLRLRRVTLGARERTCLNDVIACRPEACRFADRYHAKLREADVVHALALAGGADPEGLREAGARHEVCPHELAFDLSEQVDVVIGDYNYVFDPSSQLRRHFADAAEGWIVVVDEAHQLVERARGYASPRVEAATARRALEMLAADARYDAFRDLASEVLDRIGEAFAVAEPPYLDGEAVADLSVRTWRDLADRIDEVGLDYALLKADRPLVGPGFDDPWLELARSVLRFADGLEGRGEETVSVVSSREGQESVGLLCLDPSPWLGPKIASLGGFVGVSATLTPVGFHRDLLGLDANQLSHLRAPSPFLPEDRKVVVVPRVSTAFKDREREAAPTAAVMERCIQAIPGNVAAYFSSFAMLRDIAGRWVLSGRELLVQEPSMPEARRREWLARLATSERPVVLAAVLGGIFAEGIDLPPGALSGVLVCGPALPPVGLERNLLRDHYETRYGEGFRYASLVPGMTRVVQAAGRLLRRPGDRGAIVLLDRRFRWRDYTGLLPEDWIVEIPEDPVESLTAFYADPTRGREAARLSSRPDAQSAERAATPGSGQGDPP